MIIDLKKILLLAIIVISFSTFSKAEKSHSSIKEPYPSITGRPTGVKVPDSPDPLINYRWQRPSCDDDLEIYSLQPKSVKMLPKEFVKYKNPSDPIVVSGDCDLMFDFGQVNAGWLEFECTNMNADVTCSISEFNEPAIFNAGSEHPLKTLAPKRYGNTYRLELNKQLYEGVRYAWIHLRKVEHKITIKKVKLVCQTKPVNYEGSFSCNDTTLNRIWYTAAYTVRLNLLKDYFGAILMERSDRHSWTGDAHTSQAASLVAFGNYDFVRKNLLYTSEQYNGIESYSLYLAQSLVDYFNYTNDKETVQQLIDNACKKLESAYRQYDELPSLTFYGWDERLGGGFEHPNNPETQLAYRMLAIQSWNQFAKVMETCGKYELAARYKSYAEEKTAQLHCLPRWYKNRDIFALSDAINAGVVRPNEKEDVWQTAFTDRLQRVSYSPFNQYFVINAMARMGRHGEALHTIDDCWGGQLRYGATTFFEVFRPSWNLYKQAQNDAPVNNQCGYTSFTHPWSSGVLKWLSEEILGIRPSAPGFTEFNVCPHLTEGLTHVNGSVPTPHGTIVFKIDMLKGKGNLTVPEHTTANVFIPLMQTKRVNVFVNGKKVSVKTNGTHTCLPSLPTGTYNFSFTYEGEKVESPQIQEPIIYRYTAESVKEDSLTRGNWIGKYGSKGYMLFNFDEQGVHRSKLPAQCKSIIFQKDVNWHADELTNSLSALLIPGSKEGKRQLGGIITGDPAACWQTFTMDIDYRNNESYKVSLYLVDPNGNRRTAIELFDLDSKRILMPVHMVRDYRGGKYVTFTVDRPLRIRICQVRGDNAVCAALFLD